MKGKKTSVIICAVVFAVALCGAAIAAGLPDQPFTGGRHHRPHGNNELPLLTRYVHQNLMVKTLSEITGQPVESVEQQLKSQRLGAVLDEYKIERKAFRAALRTKIEALVSQLATSGYITPQQEKKIVEKMEYWGQRREIMTRLVEKGVEDGTITAEQAQMLLRRPR
jgi:polyhydroxyalkanoate synthesis regulator phasin